MRSAALIAAWLGALSASAQQAPTAPPAPPPPAPMPPASAPALITGAPVAAGVVTTLQLTAPWRPGEPTGSAGAPWIAGTPLRLSLQGDIFPIGREFANCASREDPSGNSVNGFAVQRVAAIRLAPTLVLHGFSSAGCPVDGAIGGGVTFTVPIQSTLALTASAGAYAVPAHAPYPARVTNDVRIDLTKTTGSDTLSVGVGKKGITVGGTW